MKTRTIMLASAFLMLWGYHSASADRESYRDCMKFGPDRSPSWALLDYESQWKICKQQEAINKQEQYEREQEILRERWGTQPPMVVIPPPPPKPVEIT